MRLVLRTYKWYFIGAVLFFWGEAFSRLAFSILIFYLFEAVDQQNYSLAYIYAVLLSLIFVLMQALRQNGFVQAHILASRIKASLLMLLYAKVSSLTGYIIKSS